MSRFTLVLLLAASTASASPTRLVDVSVSFNRHVTDTAIDTDESDKTCVSTKKTSMDLDEKVLVVAAQVPMTDAADRIALSLPRKDAHSLSGSAHLDYRSQAHARSCNSKGDDSGSATIDADAKDVKVALGFDKQDSTGDLTISIDYPDAKGQGTRHVEARGDKPETVDLASVMAAQGSVAGASMGNLSLSSSPSLAAVAKVAPQAIEAMKLLAQDQPLVVSMKNGGVDIHFTENQTIDMAKLGPPPPASLKRSATRTVTTEVTVHITPSKR